MFEELPDFRVAAPRSPFLCLLPRWDPGTSDRHGSHHAVVTGRSTRAEKVGDPCLLNAAKLSSS